MKAIIMKTKKQYIARLVLCMLLTAAALFGGAKQNLYAADTQGESQGNPSPVEAPSGTVGGLKQTGATTNSVDIQFDALLDAEAQYAVYVSNNEASGYSEMSTISGSYATVSGLSAGSTYYVKIVPFYQSEKGDKVYGTPSAAMAVVTTPNTAPTVIIQTASGANNATVNWDASAGASGYFVDYCLTGGTSSEKVRLVAYTTSATLYGLVSSKTYTVYVTPYRQSPAGFVASDSNNCISKTNIAIGTTSTGTPAGKVSGLAQKKATADSAQISFPVANDAALSYSIRLSESAKTGFSEVAVVKEGSYTFTELKAGTSYYVQVIPFYQSWNSLNEEYDRSYGTASDVFEIVTTPTAKPSKITQTKATKTGLTVSWDAVAGASGYYVDYYCAADSKHKTKTVTKNSAKLTKLEANQEYHVYVTPFKKSASGFVTYDENNYTCKYNIPVKPSKASKPKLEKFWGSLGKVNLSTKKITCADGYQYQLYTAYKDTDTKITTASSTSYSSADIKSTKLKNASVFKVRVRAYITVQGKKVYGGWSDWTYVSNPQKVTLARSNGKIRASWSKVKGADRYLVYVSTDKNGGFKKCVVTDKTSCQISSYGKSSFKSGNNYYVYVVPQIKENDVYVSTGKRDAVSEIKY